MARVMVIGGGTWQCPLVRLAKSKGNYVICSNLYENSPAFEYSDVGAVADILDKEKNLEIAKEYKPDVVITDQSDIAVTTVAYVAEKMGIRGIGINMAHRFTNKYLMRDFTNKAGFASPKYRLCYNVEDAKTFLAELPKGIIKPIDSQSSRGIHIVESASDIDRFFEDCIQYSHSEKAVLLEEYIDGTEFTVDGIKIPADYVITAISEKEHYSYNPNVARKLVFSQENERFDYNKLRGINKKMVEAMGLPFGLTHAEYKYKDGNFYLIEIAARGGGTKISSDIVPLVSGINSNEILLDVLSGDFEKIVRKPHHECAVLGFFDFKPGKVVEILGLEEAYALPGVHDLGLDVNVGDQLGQAKDDRSRCGYYIVYADSMEELRDRENSLIDKVKVVTE